jgi:glyoxylase-like metal-dependent hydrolase (beta-lactamase superfamily II)
VTADARAIAREWAEPGAYPVAPGVHRVPLPLPTDGLRAVNVYVIEAGDGLVLIDSGWALDVARKALTTALASLGAELGDVRSFLVTHVHRDHYTLGLQLRREFGSTVSLGLGERQTIAALSGGSAEPFAPQLAELRASGAAGLIAGLGDTARALPGGAADWEEPDRWLTAHQEIGAGDRTLTVVPTPGHTRGHVVFRDAAAGLLFAACPTCGCCPPMGRWRPARTPASTNCSPTTTTGSAAAWPRCRPVRPPRWRPPGPCGGPAGSASLTSWIRSTRCSP